MAKPVVVYHLPYPTTVYAARTIFAGFKGAFEDLGYDFVAYTPDDNLEELLRKHKPRLFMTASHFFFRKSLDYKLLKKYRQKHGMVLATKIDFWNSPLKKGRINEAPSMKNDSGAKQLMQKGLLADHYYSTSAEWDERMTGFKKFAKQGFITVPLAADKLTLQPSFEEKFAADISFIGTNLPQKRQFFKEWLFPLSKDYDLRLYGQDWTAASRLVGKLTKAGQYFNIPYLKQLQKPSLELNDEAKIYASSKILVNLHEDYQRTYGGDCNERTFKVPFCGGLEVVDDVAVIRDYFKEGKEIVIAKNKQDWFDRIKYYYDHPAEAKKIAEAGKKRVLKDHTYHNRAQQFIELLK